MSTPKPNDMMTCPYNPAHQVEHYRMHIHLQKCRKQHTGMKKATCPFDATHIVNEVELEYHVATCSKREMFDRQKYVVDSSYRPVSPPPAPVAPPTAENWDDDACSSYIPDLAKKGAHVITKIKGATPSERRKARMEGIRTYKPNNE